MAEWVECFPLAAKRLLVIPESLDRVPGCCSLIMFLSRLKQLRKRCPTWRSSGMKLCLNIFARISYKEHYVRSSMKTEPQQQQQQYVTNKGLYILSLHGRICSYHFPPTHSSKGSNHRFLSCVYRPVQCHIPHTHTLTQKTLFRILSLPRTSHDHTSSGYPALYIST